MSTLQLFFQQYLVHPAVVNVQEIMTFNVWQITVNLHPVEHQDGVYMDKSVPGMLTAAVCALVSITFILSMFINVYVFDEGYVFNFNLIFTS